MKLDQFIKSTLMNIAKGVHESNDEYKKLNPNHGNVFCMMYGSDKKSGTGVHFDLVVTSKKEGKAGAEAEFNVYVVEASIGGKTKMESETINKISFSVNIDQQIF